MREKTLYTYNYYIVRALFGGVHLFADGTYAVDRNRCGIMCV